MKLTLKPACIRCGDDGYYRICTPMFRDIFWVQGRFQRYEDAQRQLREMNTKKMLRLFGR